MNCLKLTKLHGFLRDKVIRPNLKYRPRKIRLFVMFIIQLKASIRIAIDFIKHNHKIKDQTTFKKVLVKKRNIHIFAKLIRNKFTLLKLDEFMKTAKKFYDIIAGFRKDVCDIKYDYEQYRSKVIIRIV